MYKVTIQALRDPTSNWKVVATGTWTPGKPPELVAEGVGDLHPDMVIALFDFSPSNESGRRQVQDGDRQYAMVYRRPSRWIR
jgi:hypothetical protein